MFLKLTKSSLCCCKLPTILVRRSVANIVPLELKPALTEGYKKSRLVDKVRIHVRGGSGGQGSFSVGGVGGKGGNVYIKCLTGASLAPYTLRNNRRIIAGHGENYRAGQMKSTPGKDIYISVPPGTEVHSDDNSLIADLNKEFTVVKIASGGHGGSARTGNFNGKRGDRSNISLVLKTIADVALTGFPNAGKSSLLRVLSRARPKVGDYAFTTIKPTVGSIFYSNSKQITIADLPGLIEDAHLNKGMGHKFLRHIERTKAIALVVDVNGFQLKTNHAHRSPFETIVILLKELALYQEALLTRPFFMILNKMDLPDADKNCELLFEEMNKVSENHPLLREQLHCQEVLYHLNEFSKNNFEKTLPVSAVNGNGIPLLQEQLYKYVPFDD